MGIELKLSPTGSSQSSGLIERFHLSIAQKLRTILLAKQLDPRLWPHVLQGVVYLYNCLPHSGIGFQVPYEQYKGIKIVSVTHLRVLGSQCTSGHPRKHLAKLYAPFLRGILVGYESDGRGSTAAYKIFDAQSHRVVSSVDVS
jgi:transposase InsO family protein